MRESGLRETRTIRLFERTEGGLTANLFRLYSFSYRSEGPNAEMSGVSNELVGAAKNPTGEVDSRRVMEALPLDPNMIRIQSGYGPMISANHPLRTRMMGGVGTVRCHPLPDYATE